MSEYYLADQRAQEREKQRSRNRQQRPGSEQSQHVKVTLLGDFLFPSGESQGCDPYNSLNGKSPREAWQSRRDRR